MIIPVAEWRPEQPLVSPRPDLDAMMQALMDKIIRETCPLLVRSWPPSDCAWPKTDGVDPDGPLVPLPPKPEPVRIVPDFPLTAYQALIR